MVLMPTLGRASPSQSRLSSKGSREVVFSDEESRVETWSETPVQHSYTRLEILLENLHEIDRESDIQRGIFVGIEIMLESHYLLISRR